MKKNTTFIAIAVILLLAALLFFLRANTTSSKNTNSNNDPIKLSIGSVFPKFNLVDIDGQTFTRSSFSKKPSIIWFTTSWCVSCQIGAKKVAKLDQELGGKAFDVLVVFIDLAENKNDLRKWKQNFANKDWIIAFDSQTNPLNKKIGLKFLDSKYLLNTNGVIQNMDFQMVNENYLNLIKKKIKNL